MSLNIFSAAWKAALLVAVTACGETAEQTGSTTASQTAASASSSSVSTGAGGQAGAPGSGGAGGAGGSMGLPERLVLTGMATGTNTETMETVICDLEGELVDLVADGDDIDGFFSGEFLRRVEVGSLAFQFEPFVAGPARVDRITAPAAELRLVGDQPPNAKPYWLAIEVLSAEEVAPFEFEGSWSCAPLEIDGNPPDYTTTVMGTFRLAPP